MKCLGEMGPAHNTQQPHFPSLEALSSKPRQSTGLSHATTPDRLLTTRGTRGPGSKYLGETASAHVTQQPLFPTEQPRNTLDIFLFPNYQWADNKKSFRIFPHHAYTTPRKEGEHASTKWDIRISRSRTLQAPIPLQSDVIILPSNVIAITPHSISPYPTSMDPHHATHNMPQGIRHSTPAPTSLYSIGSLCTNQPGNTNIQPNHTKTHRPQPHTRAPLGSMATKI